MSITANSRYSWYVTSSNSSGNSPRYRATAWIASSSDLKALLLGTLSGSPPTTSTWPSIRADFRETIFICTTLPPRYLSPSKDHAVGIVPRAGAGDGNEAAVVGTKKSPAQGNVPADWLTHLSCAILACDVAGCDHLAPFLKWIRQRPARGIRDGTQTCP